MAMAHNPDFTAIVAQLGLRKHGSAPHPEKRYVCPFCGARGKFYMNALTGLWQCKKAKCGRTGNIKQLCDALGRSDMVEQQEVAYIPIVPRKKLAPIEIRARVYETLLNKLTLSPWHEENLISRGLSADAIKVNKYKSIPYFEARLRWQIARELAENTDLSGVPGFYTRTSRAGKEYWDFMSPPGFFIPVRDTAGRIQALTIRTDNVRRTELVLRSKPQKGQKDFGGYLKEVTWAYAEGADGGKYVIVGIGKHQETLQSLKPRLPHTLLTREEISKGNRVLYIHPYETGKYLLFSSNGKPNGSSPGSPVHYTGGDGEILWVTEGPLKADIARYLMNDTPFLGIQGVNSWKEAPKMAQGLGYENSIVAMDADATTNSQVAATVEQMVKALRASGLNTAEASWSVSLGKGIDDVMVRLHNKEVSSIVLMIGGRMVRIRQTVTTEVEMK